MENDETYDDTWKLNSILKEELGDISGKSIIHLRCNIGDNTILLSQMGAALAVGVDDNAECLLKAKKLSEEFGIHNTKFIESNIVELKENHNEKYDIVFTTEVNPILLHDIDEWAETIRHLLKENGVLYLRDLHPFCSILKLNKGKLEVKNPYFSKYFKYTDVTGSYTISEIINSLINVGLTIEFFNEFDAFYRDFFLEDSIGEQFLNKQKIPFLFSLKAKLKM